MSKSNRVLSKLLVTPLLGMGLALGLTGAKQVNPPSAQVKVGVILPLTGPTATFGQESLNGLKLAMEKLGNKSPKFTLVVEDTKGTPKDSAAAINKLINTDRVSVVVGEVASTNTNAAAPAAQQAKVPLMTHASTNDAITKGKDYVSRICFIDSFQGMVMAKFALGDLKAKNAAILVDSDSDYSRGLRDSFAKAFTAGGGKIVAEASYSQKDPEFTAVLMKVKKASPKADVVFVPGYYTQVGAILKQAKELKIEGKFLGTDGWDSADLFKLAGPNASAGHYISSHFAPDDVDPNVQAFVKEYKAKFGQTPGAMAALGYDAGMYLHKALEGKDPSKLKPAEINNAVNTLKGFEGITGKITLDADRNAIKPAIIVETTTNSFKYKARVNP